MSEGKVRQMSPQETSKWCSSLALCGVKGQVLRDLQDQIVRRQIDGAQFDHMLRSNTLIDLGIEELNARMALAIRRSWTTDFGKDTFSSAGGDRAPALQQAPPAMPEPDIQDVGHGGCAFGAFGGGGPCPSRMGANGGPFSGGGADPPLEPASWPPQREGGGYPSRGSPHAPRPCSSAGCWQDEDPYMNGGNPPRHPMYGGGMMNEPQGCMPGLQQLNCRGACAQQHQMPPEDYNGRGVAGMGMPQDFFGHDHPRRMGGGPPQDMYAARREDPYVNGRGQVPAIGGRQGMPDMYGGNGRAEEMYYHNGGPGMAPPPPFPGPFGHAAKGGRGIPQEHLNGRGYGGADAFSEAGPQAMSDMRDLFGSNARGGQRGQSPPPPPQQPVEYPVRAPGAPLPADMVPVKGGGKGGHMMGGMREPGWDRGGYPCGGDYDGRGRWDGRPDEGFPPRRPATAGYPPEEAYRPYRGAGRGACGRQEDSQDDWGGPPGSSYQTGGQARGPPDGMQRASHPEDDEDYFDDSAYLASQAAAAQRRPEARAREAQRQANADWGGLSLGDALQAPKRPPSRSGDNPSGASRGANRRDFLEATSSQGGELVHDGAGMSDDAGPEDRSDAQERPLRRVPREPQVPDNGWGGQSLSEAFASKKAAPSGGSTGSRNNGKQTQVHNEKSSSKSIEEVVAWVRSLPDGHVPEKSRESIAAIVEERGLNGSTFTEFVRTVPPEVCAPKNAIKLKSAWNNVLAEAAAIEVATSNFEANQTKQKATMIVV
mmetsp:Transcript_43531/g.102587  ORF Transcript_43531/g.102587 Transcript_43531/m.102587 type:complete len:766 (+) Transcript_43531:117-2414(+)|eukprot:CAMPEP_0178409772 /NCGR_PEP_ID=MMETSP0689_2-20121128/20633_1 /TAXON_ID=160604 /ORGANISM="Amphidinium massartii, Strain CS-259" /LENGTH=765 /DNA_ID=CAMNT_0020030921 /DNA_START=17 /DNA_END=2314 /DNA_ORIENTATION=+